jgi:hypothetical protein
VRRLVLRFCAVASLTCGAWCGCTKGKPVDVAPIAAEDDALKKSESDLIGQRGALQRERKKIVEERAALVEKRKTLGHDSAGQAALDEDDKKLLQQESDLVSREHDIDDKLDQLLKQREELVQKVTSSVAGAAGADPAEHAARREQSVAAREKDIAQREKDMADRERSLAEREAREAKREKEACSTVAAAPVEVPKGLKYSARDVEPTYKKALKIMQDRGLLADDLAAAAHLVSDVRESMKKGDFVRAKYDADALLAACEGVRIDREFITAKMGRLNSAIRARKLEGESRKKSQSLLEEITGSYGDGKFAQANTKINTVFAMLK